MHYLISGWIHEICVGVISKIVTSRRDIQVAKFKNGQRKVFVAAEEPFDTITDTIKALTESNSTVSLIIKTKISQNIMLFKHTFTVQCLCMSIPCVAYFLKRGHNWRKVLLWYEGILGLKVQQNLTYSRTIQEYERYNKELYYSKF